MRERSAPSESTTVGLSSILASQGNFLKEKTANADLAFLGVSTRWSPTPPKSTLNTTMCCR